MQEKKTKYKIINGPLLKQFDSFISNLSANDKIAIFHDSDPDGICSGVIAAKTIHKLTGKKITFHMGRDTKEYGISSTLIKNLRKHKITKLITVDISCDENTKTVFETAKFADILIIDRHKLYHDLNNNYYNNSSNKSGKIVVVKPQMIFENVDPTLYCNSKFSFDLFSRHTNLDELDWAAATGIIGDCAGKMWKPFLKKVFKKYNITPDKNLFETKLGNIARMINSAGVYSNRNVTTSFNTIYNAQNPADVLKSKLAKYQKIIEKEINYFINKAEKLAEFYDDKELVYYLLKPKHTIKSPLCTILAFKFPEKTVIVLIKKHNQIQVSARRQDKKIAMNDLLERTVKGFQNADAGGHCVAAGASFPAKYLDEFKNKLLQNLSIRRPENRKI